MMPAPFHPPSTEAEMAEKASDIQPGRGRPERSDIEAALRAVNRAKDEASEHVGRAGKATADFCERWSVSRKAFTYVANMSRRDPADAMDQLCQTLVLAEAAGLFDQIDMFNDAIAVMRDIIERAEAGGAPRGDAGALGAMVN